MSLQVAAVFEKVSFRIVRLAEPLHALQPGVQGAAVDHGFAQDGNAFVTHFFLRGPEEEPKLREKVVVENSFAVLQASESGRHLLQSEGRIVPQRNIFLLQEKVKSQHSPKLKVVNFVYVEPSPRLLARSKSSNAPTKAALHNFFFTTQYQR